LHIAEADTAQQLKLVLCVQYRKI